MLSPELREYAETPDRFAPIFAGSSVTRFDDGRVCVVQGPTWASVSGVRVDEGGVAQVLAEVRAVVPRESNAVWWIGPSARPADVELRLRELGLTDPRDRVTELRALVLVAEPAHTPPGVEVRIVETFEDFAAAREVQWDAFDTPEERRELIRRRIRDDFEESTRLGVPVGFLATFDDRPAATATAIPGDRGVFLIAGATAPWARGRGLYRALVRARWDYAVARGTPTLVTHAAPATSHPILLRLGFTEVCTIRRLEDRR